MKTKKKRHIGKMFSYSTHSGDLRTAKCIGIEWIKGIHKPIFIGISPFGHKVRLTREEIGEFHQ